MQALADADKERYAAECASAGESGNKENKPAAEKKARAPKAAKIKTAYEVGREWVCGWAVQGVCSSAIAAVGSS